jgi:DNA primase
MDVISSHQAGVKNVVGVSGTALTTQQMKLISRYVPEIILALDADEAGSEATKRAVEVAGEFDVSVKVALFGEHKDPDALIQAGVEKWQEALDGAVPVMDFYFESVIKRFDIQKIEDKKHITKELLSIIHKLADPIEKDFYIKKLGRLIDVEPKILYDALSKTSNKPRRFVTPKEKQEMPVEMMEDRVVAMANVYPQFAKQAITDGEKIKWASTLAKSVYDELKTWYNARSDFESNKFLQQLSANDRTSLLELMLVVEENYKDVAEENIEGELTFYLDLLKKRSYASRRGELVREIELAEKSQDKERLDELLVELKNL